MKIEFGVRFYSAQYNSWIVFASTGRTPTRQEFGDLIVKHESVLAGCPPEHTEIVALGFLPPTNEVTLEPTLIAEDRSQD